MTKAQCKKFRLNPCVNPLTGRPILMGNATYKKLVKACEQMEKALCPKMIPERDVPPMGPYIDWEFNPEKGQHTDKIILNTVISFINFIHERLQVLKEDTHVSMMELNDFKDLLRNMDHWLNTASSVRNEETLLKQTADLRSVINDIKHNSIILDDEPEETVIAVAVVEVKPSRYFNRGRVLRGYSMYMEALGSIEESLELGYIRTYVCSSFIKDVCRYKTYFDYLIEHRVFSYNDIYKRTFKSDTVYEDLKEIYKKYTELYVKENVSSP